MDKPTFSLKDFKDLLIEYIATREEKLALELLKYNTYKKEAEYLNFKKTVSHFLINFGLPSVIEECYKQKIFTLKLKISKGINSVDFTFLTGNVHMLNFILSKGVSLHKEENDYHYLNLLASNSSRGAECYQFLSKNGYLETPEKIENKKYFFLDRVILNRNIRLLAAVLEEGKFQTQMSLDEVKKKLSFENNSPYTKKSLEIMKANVEKEYLEKSIQSKKLNKLSKKI